MRKNLHIWTPRLVDKLQDAAATARCGDRSAEPRACRHRLSSTATRLRAWESASQQIDDTLYDAFGQRQVSTMFTQLNQYHVVLEVATEFP